MTTELLDELQALLDAGKFSTLSHEMLAVAPALLSAARENLRLREALEDIARQKLIEELDEEEFDSADFETGYDMIVSEAREALGKEAP
jgi:hypothetical protein